MSKFYKFFKSNSPSILLLLLLILTFFFRASRLSTPPNYVFDEVYHVPTIKAIANNNKDSYNPFAKSPEPNTAYDWLHPPLAKLIQAASINLLGENSFAWRLPSAVFGTLSVAALYFFTLTLFKNQQLALLTATIFSLDNLQLTMSRIAMNDIFVTTWIILALTFFYRFIKSDSLGQNQGRTLKGSSLQASRYAKGKVQPYWNFHLLLTAVFTGLSLATKHSSIFLYPIFFIFIFKKLFTTPSAKPVRPLVESNLAELFKSILILTFIPLAIYFLSYLQMFLQGSTLTDFFNLHKQIYWYQTGLTATHSFQSAAWQWPLLIRPVWFHVKYLPYSTAHIYNLGNPLIFWAGLVTVGLGTFSILQGSTLLFRKVQPYCDLNRIKYPLICYFFLFFPWVFSPRILFLHHYLPALPFLSLIIAFSIYNHRRLTLAFLILTLAVFIFFYPLNTAIPINKDWLKYFFWLPTWR